MVKKLATVAAGVFALVAVTSGAAFAQAGPSKCSGGKIKTAGKKAGGKLNCLAKGLSKGLATDGTCLSKAEAKFSTAYAKAEAKVPNDCLTTGDAGAIEAKVDALVQDLDDLNAPPPNLSACDAAKVKAAGKKAAAKLTCHSKAVTKGLGVDSTCMAKAEVKFSQAVAKAEAKAAAKSLPCSGTGDAGTYESTIDAAVQDIVDESAPTCEPIITGQPIAGTYSQGPGVGSKVCSTHAAANKFGPCNTDADCGGTSGSCFMTPWVTVGNLPAQATPAGTTTFTIAAAGSYPACAHQACVKCGNPNAPCASIPGCTGNPQCVSDKCCDDPGFVLPALFIAGVGACTRQNQIACGTGEVNTSNPQTGDNEVDKDADSSDPGADCTYGTGDDPAPTTCNSFVPGNAGNDGGKGKVVRTVGNGAADSNGIHIRLQTPGLTTAWSGDDDGCPTTATFDGGAETVLTSLILRTEPSTAGATGAWVDMDADACALPVGSAGFGNGAPNAGPVNATTATAAAPAPYGGGPSRSAAIGQVFSGLAAAGFDIGFVALTPNGALSVAPADTCSCTPTAGCPE
jgi:hypothetical protein